MRRCLLEPLWCRGQDVAEELPPDVATLSNVELRILDGFEMVH